MLISLGPLAVLAITLAATALVLCMLRRGRKGSSSPDGCEPDVSAEQVSLHLERAAAERKALEPPPGVIAAVSLTPAEEALEPWVAIALDEDLDEPLPATGDVWVLTPVVDVDAVLASVAPAPKKKNGKPQQKPAQDEWGFFDPNQCGFAALVARLDEITENGTAMDQGADVTVRVIEY